MDIAAHSETRFPKQGRLEKVCVGYTFWSGRPKAERRSAGVVFAIRNDIVGRLPCLPQGAYDRLMGLRLPLREGKFVLIINVYAPPITSPDVTGEKEKCQEMRTHPYSTLVGLTNAFDRVNREGLWKIMKKSGCPERFTQIVRQLHDGMMARDKESYALTNGVKQDCILAPTLFTLMFSAMLMDAYCEERPGIRIAYRTDRHLVNHRGMHFQSRVYTTTYHELIFADDCALSTTSKEDMQKSMDPLSAASENFGLIIYTEKTVVVHQPPPNTSTSPQCAANQRERNPIASGGQRPVPGQYPLPQHQNRRRSGPPDFRGQSSLRSSSKRSLESSSSSAQHETEDVPGLRPPNTTVWSRLGRCTRSRHADSTTSTSAVFAAY
ncbi:hypothetical protein SprV_0200631600 [Sparganum proliferum]